MSNLDFDGSYAAELTFFKAIPWVVIATFVLGLAGVLMLRSTKRGVFDSIGRTVFEETHERVGASGDTRHR